MNEELKKASTISKLFNALGALALTILTTIGLFYVFHGNLIIVGILFIVILVGIMLISKYLIDNKLKKRSGTKSETMDTRIDNRKPEYILLSLYFLIGIVLFPFIYHFIDVDFARKNELRIAGITKVKSITDLKIAYNDVVQDSINKKIMQIESIEKAYFFNKNNASTRNELLGFLNNNPSVLEDEDTKLKGEIKRIKHKVPVIFEENYGLGNVETEINEYVEKASFVFEKWKMKDVSKYFLEIDKKFDEYYIIMTNKIPGFSFNKPKSEEFNVDSPLYSLLNGTISRIFLVFIFVMFLMVLTLWEYFNTGRKKSSLIKKDTQIGMDTHSIKMD